MAKPKRGRVLEEGVEALALDVEAGRFGPEPMAPEHHVHALLEVREPRRSSFGEDEPDVLVTLRDAREDDRSHRLHQASWSQRDEAHRGALLVRGERTHRERVAARL